jgi:hypothetical protein
VLLVRTFGILAELSTEREAGMAKVNPYHSASPNDRNVYHDHDDCTEGNNIEKQNIRQGTGNRPRCDHCVRLG